jgi:hypothetical protein
MNRKTHVLISFVNWAVMSEQRFIVLNTLYFSIPLWLGLTIFSFSRGELDLKGCLAAALISALGGLVYSILLWNSFFIKRLRENLSKREDKR